MLKTVMPLHIFIIIFFTEEKHLFEIEIFCYNVKHLTINHFIHFCRINVLIYLKKIYNDPNV